MLSAKWRPFCLGLNVLTGTHSLWKTWTSVALRICILYVETRVTRPSSYWMISIWRPWSWVMSLDMSSACTMTVSDKAIIVADNDLSPADNDSVPKCEPVLADWQLGPEKQIVMNFESKYSSPYTIKSIWKCLPKRRLLPPGLNTGHPRPVDSVTNTNKITIIWLKISNSVLICLAAQSQILKKNNNIMIHSYNQSALSLWDLELYISAWLN